MATTSPAPQPHARVVVCPSCRSDAPPEKVTFTWWGGLLGPKLLKHVKCSNCGAGFNSQTGNSNTTAIAIYLGVGFGIGIAIFVLLSMVS